MPIPERLHFNYEQVQKAMKAAKTTLLYSRDRQDAILIFAIEHRLTLTSCNMNPTVRIHVYYPLMVIDRPWPAVLLLEKQCTNPFGGVSGFADISHYISSVIYVRFYSREYNALPGSLDS